MKAAGAGARESRATQLAKAYRIHERTILAELQQTQKGGAGPQDLRQVVADLRYQIGPTLEDIARQIPFAALDNSLSASAVFSRFPQVVTTNWSDSLAK